MATAFNQLPREGLGGFVVMFLNAISEAEFSQVPQREKLDLILNPESLCCWVCCCFKKLLKGKVWIRKPATNSLEWRFIRFACSLVRSAQLCLQGRNQGENPENRGAGCQCKGFAWPLTNNINTRTKWVYLCPKSVTISPDSLYGSAAKYNGETETFNQLW